MKVLGVFDSGVGALSLLPYMKRLGVEKIICICDNAYGPYGKRTNEEILSRSHQLTSELVSAGAEGIMVACNTATTVAIESLRKKFNIKFLGVEPYINVINHLEDFDKRKFLLLCTPATFNSQKFKILKDKIDPSSLIDVYANERLAPFIEDNIGNFQTEEFSIALDKTLEELKGKNYSDIILGCTHYPLIEKQLKDFFQALVHSNEPALLKQGERLWGVQTGPTQIEVRLSKEDRQLEIKIREFLNQ